MLHVERDALQYAAAEHRQARHHAEQVFEFAGFPEALQNEIALRDERAMTVLSDIVTQGRAEVQTWRCFARSQQEATLLEAAAHRALSDRCRECDLGRRQQFDGMNMHMLQLRNEIHLEISKRDFYAEAEVRAVKPFKQELSAEIAQRNFCAEVETNLRGDILSMEVTLDTPGN